MATQEFYIRNETDTEARGPFTIEQLSSLIDSGQVTPGTLYYDATTEQWTGIDQDAALKEVLFPEKKRLTMRSRSTFGYTDQRTRNLGADHGQRSARRSRGANQCDEGQKRSSCGDGRSSRYWTMVRHPRAGCSQQPENCCRPLNSSRKWMP